MKTVHSGNTTTTQTVVVRAGSGEKRAYSSGPLGYPARAAVVNVERQYGREQEATHSIPVVWLKG